jgi:CrcB protein
MKSMTVYAAVAAGGALGALLRHGLQHWALRALGPAFPWGTLGVNVAGCFAMGFLVVWLAGREPNPPALRAFLAVGLLGGFTTFSAFALDLVTLYREKAISAAAFYLCASLLLSVGGLVAGLLTGRALL